MKLEIETLEVDRYFDRDVGVISAARVVFAGHVWVLLTTRDDYRICGWRPLNRSSGLIGATGFAVSEALASLNRVRSRHSRRLERTGAHQ